MDELAQVFQFFSLSVSNLRFKDLERFNLSVWMSLPVLLTTVLSSSQPGDVLKKSVYRDQKRAPIVSVTCHQ